MIEDNKEVVDVSSIDTQIEDIANQVLSEKDPEKVKQLIALFNWNISKKNTSRILKLNNLYDDVTNQMVLRFKTKSDQFSNSDLLDYMKAVQGAIDTSTKNLSQIEDPPTIIQQNNTQINVNIGDSFDRDAKDRILAAIQATLKSAQQTQDPEPDLVEMVEVDREIEIPVDTDTSVIEIASNCVEELESVVDKRKETNG